MWRPPSPEEPTQVGSVYVLHFSHPVGTAKQQAAHYIGWASDASQRIAAHQQGRGGKLTKHAVRQGVELQVAQVYDGVTRDFERRLKNRGGASRICAICTAQRKQAIDNGVLGTQKGATA